jgi:hypothetical protein
MRGAGELAARAHSGIRRIPPLRLDGLLYLVSAIYAGVYALWPALPTHRAWGRAVEVPYALIGLTALALSSRRVRLSPRATTWCRIGLALVAVVCVLLVPLGREVTERARNGFVRHVRSEAIVVEEGARTFSHQENPYAAVHDEGPLRGYPDATHIRFPYLPTMLVFGAARAIWGPVSLADARVAFTIATFAIAALVAVLWGRRHGRLRALQVLILLPTGALPLVTGGHDIPVLALTLLTLVLLRSRRPVGAGLALGLAATMRQLAWPLLPLVALAARHRDGRTARLRTTIAFCVPALVVNLPFFLWDPHAFVDDVVRFPLGLTDLASPAASPTLGRALAWSPVKLLWVGGLVAAVALLVFARRRRWVITPTGVALAASGMLTFAVLLAPASRWGLLVYGLDLAAWALLLRPGEANDAGGRPQPVVL